jgi:hypothetical protein
MTPPRSLAAACVVLATVLLDRLPADAMCNTIPSVARTFASTPLGEIDRPYALPGHRVVIRLGECDDPSLEFVPGETAITVTFTPPAGPVTSVPVQSRDVIRIARREAAFLFPDTEADGGTLLTGPATLTVTVRGAPLMTVGTLGTRDGACAFRPSALFPSFTALPPSNRFEDAAADATTRLLATTDADGNLLIPFDWRGVAPPGGVPDSVATLVRAGQSSLPAFPGESRGIIIPSAAYVTAHTLDGSVLPAFVEVGPADGSGMYPGTTIFGTVDDVDGIVRVARQVGDAPPIFDLHTRLRDGVGPIVAERALAFEGPQVELASMASSSHVVAFEERLSAPNRGLIVYDRRSGSLARLSRRSGPRPQLRRFSVNDEALAFYDAAVEERTADLSVYPISSLPRVAGIAEIDEADALKTGIYGRKNVGFPVPPLGNGIVGGFDATTRTVPVVFDLVTRAITEGSPTGGADLILKSDGLYARGQPDDALVAADELAPVSSGLPATPLVQGNLAVFVACPSACADPQSGGPDRVLYLVEADKPRRELARNVGVPFAFTGSLVALAAYEDGSFGSGPPTDADEDGSFDGRYLRIFDVEHGRLLTPRWRGGRPLPLPAALRVAASDRLLALAIDESQAGRLNCDADTADQVVVLFEADALRIVNTREPLPLSFEHPLRLARGLLTYGQQQDVSGKELPANFLHVERDSDGDGVLDSHDDCPLRPDPRQLDADGDGIGDACDPDCADGTCNDDRAAQADCLARLDAAGEHLFSAALHRSCAAGACPPRGGTIARARTLVAGCDPAALAALAPCGDTRTDPARTVTCLVNTATSAVNALNAVLGNPLAVARRCAVTLRKTIARQAQTRTEGALPCRRNLDRGGQPVASDGTPILTLDACANDSEAAPKLIAAGQALRRRIAAACTPDEITDLGACGGLATTLQDLASDSGTGGCLLRAAALAADDVLAHGSVQLEGGSGFVEPPCPSPAPSPSPGALGNSITVRIGRGELDLGWVGATHDVHALEGAHVTADLRCDEKTAECEIIGGSHDTLFGAPVPVAVQSMALCLVHQVFGEVTGHVDPATGSLEVTVPLRIEVQEGTTAAPCAFCATADGDPQLGERGTCAGGRADGRECTVEALNSPWLGAAAGTSTDCPPAPLGHVAAARVSLELTTGTSILATSATSPMCAAPRINQHCPCEGQYQRDACSGPSGCMLDQQGDYVCEDVDEVCPSHPDRTCNPNDHTCDGEACIYAPRPCFPDPIVRHGTPDPTHPTLVATYCMPKTGFTVADTNRGGLPGPAALTLAAELEIVR